MSLLDNSELTEEELAYQGLQALPEKYQKTVGFFAWDYFVATAKVLYSLWDKIIYVCKCLVDLSNMDYDDLVNFVYQTRGIEAKCASASSGELTLSTGSGTITRGDIFTTLSGIEFEATETKTVAEGEKFEVKCTQTGVIGNVDANTITIIPTTIGGVVSVTNETAFTNGYDDETKEALLERYYDDIRNNITSGNIYHYRKWAKEITGVADVKVKPLWDGDNTVKVIVLDANTLIPSDDLIAQVQEYIDPYTLTNGVKVGWGCGNGQAPIGAYCTVAKPTVKNINVSATVTLETGYTSENVTSNIEDKINKYLKDIAFKTNSVSYSHISAAILDAEGVQDHSDLEINDGVSSIPLTDSDSDTEVAVLNDLDLTFS